ncbi:YggS family pyridoxal phosphate-dependent enzyme [Dechloromonas sp. HYN0024]|uniref:YggS family pyridoxal phosphate-dependent enzyme n=1 Tax=Dechloromonas sp. HYN0024 TaxID=2231055 RepID=UPI000E437003|nr:YggS family pyridoxal phosphate-dependent enzyme [Dechloromonas sp. HYN0024]AXS81134.1 YggS family pyridoxal phosphate-dependent enzyme [Dechloromonas sp. HYN0024]
MSAIADNLQAVQARIRDAAVLAGRSPESIRLLAVSKTWPLPSVIDAADAGQSAFGENYVQEGVDKQTALAGRHLDWHFIGPLQSNKSRLVAEHFDWVHSIDRLKIAERLSAQRPTHLPPMQVCVQVNVSGEASKSGCAPADARALCQAVAALPGLQLRGLMAIPEPTDDPAAQRAPFRQVRELFENIRAAGLPLDTLSMGMSHDLEAAIAEGATIVRIGTAIFGERNYS